MQVDGCGCNLLINFCLTLVSCNYYICWSYLSVSSVLESNLQIPIMLSQCLWCPGVIHAFWVVMKADTAADKPVVVVVNRSQAQPQQA